MLTIAYKTQSSDTFSIMAQSIDPLFKMFKSKTICDNMRLECFQNSHCTACGNEYTCIQGECKKDKSNNECDEKLGINETAVLLANGFVDMKCISRYPKYYDNDGLLKPNICRGGDMDVDVILGKLPSAISCTCPKTTDKIIIHDVPYCVANKSFYM